MLWGEPLAESAAFMQRVTDAAGANPITHPADLTVEAFVKVNRQMPHHVLLVSKRRNGQRGATWSLSIDPGGRNLSC